MVNNVKFVAYYSLSREKICDKISIFTLISKSLGDYFINKKLKSHE